MTDLPPQTQVYVAPPPAKPKPGFVAAIVACGFGALGIVMPVIGLVFVAVAAIVALVATLRSLFGGCMSAFGFSLLAWLLVVMGLLTSPMFLMAVGSQVDKKNGALSEWMEKIVHEKQTTYGEHINDYAPESNEPTYQ